MRAKNHWLVLGVSFLIVTSTISVTLLVPSGSKASNIGERSSSLYGDYEGLQHCRECHEEEFQAWSGTSHARASFDPIFQTFLQSAAEPGECFSCHATGYNSVTGKFVLAGVTCEACHGPYREDHPDVNMMIAPPKELCGACHTGTLAEWMSSRHGKVGVTCTNCHEVHTQKTFSIESTDDLCTGCHENRTQDSVHVIHRHSETGVHCSDCHVACSSGDVSGAVQGNAVTGHAFVVLVSTCDDCHPARLQPGVELP